MTHTVLFTESSANVGGQEFQCMQQMRQLQAIGVRTVLACPPGGRVEREARRQGLDTLAVPFRNSAHLPSIIRLCRWIRKNRPLAAICHSGHDSDNLAIAARLVADRPRIVRSRTYHSGRATAISYNWLADAAMLPSEYLRRCLLANSRVDASRLHVVYPGIDFDALDRSARAGLPAPLDAWLRQSDGPVLVHAAMLRGEKGQLTILAAMSLLTSRYPTLRYVMAGEGSERARIEAEIERRGLQSRVLLTGVLTPVASLLARADLVVMPSSYEPLGMSQIEALGLGVPVVASRTGGIPETVCDGRTGLLAEPGDALAWAEAIGWALDNYSTMLRWAEAGREDVRSRFAAQTNLRRILQLTQLVAPDAQAA